MNDECGTMKGKRTEITTDEHGWVIGFSLLRYCWGGRDLSER